MTICEEILLIKLDKCSKSQANIQIRVDLFIQAPIYTIEDSLLHSTVLTIQTNKYNYPIRSKYDN